MVTQRFNVLSLSGGGFLGLYSICILVEIEKKWKKPIGRSCELLAGTSVGGIVALGLAAEIPAQDILSAFEKEGKDIFSNRPKPTGFIQTSLDVMRSLFTSKYNQINLRRVVSSLIGEETLIGDLKHPILIPTVNLTKGGPQVFRTPHHPSLERDLHLKAIDVAMATSAAPTYFPLHEIDDCLYADGGLYANSPDTQAVHEAEYFMDANPDEIHLLSIGTTTSKFSFSHKIKRDIGAIGWMREQRLVKTMIASQQHLTNHLMKHKYGERYMRLDEIPSKEQGADLALDVADDATIKTLRGLANGTVQNVIGQDFINSFFEHNATEPKFFHLNTME